MSISISKDGNCIEREIIIDTNEEPIKDGFVLNDRDSVHRLVNKWNAQAVYVPGFPKHIYYLV